MPTDIRMSCPNPATKPPVAAAVSDGELLQRFVDRWDNEAFCGLLRRHGPIWSDIDGVANIVGRLQRRQTGHAVERQHFRRGPRV
jgi:hypothetical protein